MSTGPDDDTKPHGQGTPYAGPYAGPHGGPYGGPWAPAPEHPQATVILVLGILSLVVCQLTGPFAWVMGRRALAEIDASGGRLGGRQQAQVGMVLGIVGTVLLGLAVLMVLAYLVLVGVVLASS